MNQIPIYLTGGLYFLVSSALFLYGLHCLAMLTLGWFMRKSEFCPQTRHWKSLPPVTVQIPIYNEMYVAERIINAVCSFDYPAELLHIQVLDDSTDETVDIASQAVHKQGLTGVNIEYIHRTDRKGYKAGALAYGTESAQGDFIAIFDADFVPPASYLREMIPYFQPDVAFVQARWGHINPNQSLLTRMQAVLLDAHFTLEQMARSRLGLGFNFNGTAGVWRKAALESAGGWQADTLTEDIDLSYRAFLSGWRAVYVNDIVVPAELPVSVQGFRRQQYRWARGSLECAFKLLPQIWRSPQSWPYKLAATFHLTGYSIHFYLLGLILLYPLLLHFEADAPGLIKLFNIAYVFAFTAIFPPIFFTLGQIRSGQKVQGQFWRILFITSAGAGLMVNTLSALIEIMLKRHVPFERTAKFGFGDQEAKSHPKKEWLKQNYHLTIDRMTFWELSLAMISYSTAVYAYLLNHWGITFYASVFGTGLFYLATLTIWQSWQLGRAKRNNKAAAQTKTVTTDIASD